MDIESGRFNQQITYQIIIKGSLKKKWATWLNGMVVVFRCEDTSTFITVAVPDQAALRGILNKLWDLNLTIISVLQAEEKDNEYEYDFN
jgi:hypothetical protein